MSRRARRATRLVREGSDDFWSEQFPLQQLTNKEKEVGKGAETGRRGDRNRNREREEGQEKGKKWRGRRRGTKERGKGVN